MKNIALGGRDSIEISMEVAQKFGCFCSGRVEMGGRSYGKVTEETESEL